MCTKWGKGGSDGATLRDGAIWLIARLLRLFALHANTGTLAEACAFEANAIKQISVSRDAAAWATAHAAFPWCSAAGGWAVFGFRPFPAS